ncbi:MAG: hypothetical protein COW00_13275 [Bdellovibrio sp. CG12_big_fil_rev_8_21_14_0_65_39_13]|nr:MAG: hypothetical protein COW78_11325 [Bdellovibrio sp. CG22_combo_CG10-13_8_21_14_all_39_27]PIQ58901.1 MAG: hypothetical protein COW00_13275 [Bdellovibrio sp. CG12_big_fil_rev_8_21_14_0_65_39_13]PIR35992.1 MAG: hypothetical protein COV37_05650 [Bdellovibrio sp. CG11_big_fil_rev_8_21_14_0_20_39_38]
MHQVADAKTDSKYLKILRFRKIILFLLFSLLMYASSQLSQLKVLVSMSDLVDQNMPSAKAYQELKEDFHLLPSLMIVATPINKKEQAQWTEIDQWMKHFRTNDDFVSSWLTPWDIMKTQMEPGYLRYKRVLPTIEKTRSLVALNQSPWKNILTNELGNEASLIVDFKESPPPQKYGSFNPKAVSNLIKSLQSFSFEKLKISIVGTAAFTYYATLGVAYNMKVNLFFLFVLFFLMKWLFGTFKSGLLLIVTFLWSGVLVHGLMAILGFSMEILSSGLFTMIVVASLEDFLFICHEQAKGYSIEESLDRLFWPSLITSLTTVVGFGSLIFTDIDIISRFGLWASVGAILEWVATFFLLPSIMKTFHLSSLVKVGFQRVHTFSGWTKKLDKITPPRFIAFGLLFTYIGGFFVLQNLQISDSPLSLFPQSHPLVQDFKTLSKSRGWESEASLVFEVEKSREEQLRVLDQIKKLDNISIIESVFDIEAFLLGEDTFHYKKAILSNLNQHPLMKRYRGELLSFRHILYFKNSEFQSLKKSLQEIRNICKNDCQLIGEIVSYNEFMDKVPLALMKSLGISLALVGLIIFGMALIFRYPKAWAFTLGSLWGPSCLLIMMAIMNIQINFLSCVFICMMVGLTGDNGIQFLFAEKREGKGRGIEYHQSCALQVGFIMACSCLFFLFSYFAPPREFGPMMGLGFLISLFGDIWLTKSLTQSKRLG